MPAFPFKARRCPGELWAELVKSSLSMRRGLGFLAASKGCQEHFQVRVVEFGGLYATKQYACEADAHHMTGFLSSVPPKART